MITNNTTVDSGRTVGIALSNPTGGARVVVNTTAISIIDEAELKQI